MSASIPMQSLTTEQTLEQFFEPLYAKRRLTCLDQVTCGPMIHGTMTSNPWILGENILPLPLAVKTVSHQN